MWKAWVTEVQAQYRKLSASFFDLDALCVNVPLNGLPEQSASFDDGVWTASKNPSIEDVRLAVLRIIAGQLNRSDGVTEAARACPCILLGALCYKCNHLASL